jgi:hypothetical protein
MNERMLSIAFNAEEKILYAGSSKGRLYQLNMNLEIISFSNSKKHVQGLHKIVYDNNSIFARDTTGNLIKFNKNTLEMSDLLLTEHFSTGNNPPMPVPSSGMEIYQNKIILCNANGELTVFDKDTLNLLNIIDYNPNFYTESINIKGPQHLIGDCGGNIWIGNFDNNKFEKLIKTSDGNLHSICYDKKYNRYWTSTDTYGGFWIIDENGYVHSKHKMTNDDVECIKCSPDSEKFFVACFDHYLYVYSNKEKIPSLINKIGGFKFQLWHVEYVDENYCFVILESGEIYKVNHITGEIVAKQFGSNCVWSISKLESENCETDKERLLCSNEDGTISLVEFGFNEKNKYFLRQIEKSTDYNLGRIRKSIEFNKCAIIITTSGSIASVANNEINWSFTSNGILRDLDICRKKNTVICGNESGELLEFEVDSGKLIFSLKVHDPIYSLIYTDELIIFSTRCFSGHADSIDDTESFGFIYVIDRNTYSIVQKEKIFGNIKRMKKINNNNILINGNGSIYISTISISKTDIILNLKINLEFNDWLLNTTENTLLFNEAIYAVTYGYQLNTYDLGTKSLIDSQFTVDDYPKYIFGSTFGNISVLIVSGRGFISLYDVSKKTPELVRSIYI